jgi:hypothetical protein
MSDDWGKSWGEDPDAKKEPAKKKTARKDTLMGLVIHFSELLPKDAWGKLNSPVNAKAMSVGLKKLQGAGFTPDQIRGMMTTFVLDIQRKPLAVGIAPWRAFLANLDSLASQATATSNQEPDSYDDLQTDNRLGGN